MSGPAIDPARYRDRDRVPLRRALISVSDKAGLLDLATALAAAGVEIVSTGSTASTIADAGIAVTQVGELTGYPESLDGRVRTLHPRVHSGLLADLRLESHEEELAAKKNLRLLELPSGLGDGDGGVELRRVSGGMLVQTADRQFAPALQWRLVAGEAVDAQTLADLEFAWRACRSVKSNAILLASGGASVGIGMGQVNRVDSCRLAVERAGARAAGSVAASDAFFPFADGAQILIDAGVRAIVQPGGSVRDDEVIAAAAAAGVPMYVTGERHFAH